jgi:predicted AAA+ superfamily ATPase
MFKYYLPYYLAMMLKDTLKNIIETQRWELNAFDPGVERKESNLVDTSLPYAIIISGIRRCGKSTLLHQLLGKLNSFYYLNFEDTRLIGFEAQDFEKLDEAFDELYGEAEFYLFDEIQNIENWEIFVRSRLDRRKKFIITGSNASLLSRELGTRLTGRHVDIELFPFSFEEMLLFGQIKGSADTFDEYLFNGGFPEYLKFRKPYLLRELLNDILQRDIVARHNIRDSRSLRAMAVYLLTNAGKVFSYNGLRRMFDLGSTNTAISYVSYLEDSYLIFTVPKFDYSLKKQIVNERKVYSVDNGLSVANSASLTRDKGRMLENAVFVALRRSHREIYYFRERGECDFLIKEGNALSEAIQVTYELNEDNKDREINGLLEALSKFDLVGGLILTHSQEDRFTIDGREITVLPVWKWMLRT